MYTTSELDKPAAARQARPSDSWSASRRGSKHFFAAAALASSIAISALPLAAQAQAPLVKPHEQVVSTTEHHSYQLPQLAQRVMVGAFTYGGVWRGMKPVLQLESDLGRRLDIVHWFTNWDHPFYPDLAIAVAAAGRKPLISWQPHTQSVSDIAAGVYDDYIAGWAAAVAGVDFDVYLRPFPEMNGDWVDWNGDPKTFRQAWRRMAGIFEQTGADNVRWVFSPNVTDSPRTAANRLELYYPGAAYVDVLALDGYNWGTTREWTAWRPFEEVFESGYQRIIALGDQPVWFAEMSSSAAGGDKASWVTAMLSSTAFERLTAIIWFDEHKEADWRMVADPEVASAFRRGLQRPQTAQR